MYQKELVFSFLFALSLALGPVLVASANASTAAGAYENQIRMWNRPEEVHAWIARCFTYNKSRAIALSEKQRVKGTPFHIYKPEEFFEKPAGICVDVARFAVETLREIAPDLEPKYLLIKFDPVRIKGNVLRMHWLANFQKDGKHYFFADSYFPGTFSGPYDNVSGFIEAYQDARDHKIVSFRLVDTFRKQRKKRRLKRMRPPRKKAN